MEEKIIECTEKKIKEILDSDISPNNVEYLYKLSKIKHMAKEDENMYGNYGGRGPSRGAYGAYGAYGNYGEGSYGEYGAGSYGRRGRDRRYRGEEEMDRMAGEYGRYQESRSYGAGEEADKSFHYMVKALEDFIKVLQEEAETPQQKQMLNEALQKSMR